MSDIKFKDNTLVLKMRKEVKQVEFHDLVPSLTGTHAPKNYSVTPTLHHGDCGKLTVHYHGAEQPKTYIYKGEQDFVLEPHSYVILTEGGPEDNVVRVVEARGGHVVQWDWA